MIIEWMIRVGVLIFDAIFSLLGILPNFSSEVIGTIDSVFNFMFVNGIGLVGIFLDLRMVKILIPIVIAILNFDNIIKFIMFVLKKIPILGIK